MQKHHRLFSTSSLTTLLLLVLFIVGGVYAYRYLIERPPTPLIELVTKTDAPPPLPQGDNAPLRTMEGFEATIFARDIKGARVLTRDPKGTMLVSQTSEGTITALPDLDSNGLADTATTVLKGLKQPHGILVHCPDTGTASTDQDACVLYVAETNAVKSYHYDADTLSATFIETLTTLPEGSGHYTRTLLMHPDGKRLLVSVGSSCNVCTEEDAKRATVLAIDLATHETSIFASGLRNTVFMAIDPVMGEIWGTDNGRDMLGDDIPPDEVNILTEGSFYGWPLCYATNVHDTNFDSRSTDPCASATSPHIALPAHSAALGIAFIPEEGWPEEMRNDVLVAYHGSWNRSEPIGYAVVRFDLDQDRNATGSSTDFLTGFLTTADVDDAIGRPVGILTEPGGVTYVTDDRAGAIYRISRQEI